MAEFETLEPAQSALSSLNQRLHWLTCYLSDEVEVFVYGKNCQASFLSGRRNEQVRDGRGAMVSSVGEKHLNLEGAVFNLWSEVLDQH